MSTATEQVEELKVVLERAKVALLNVDDWIREGYEGEASEVLEDVEGALDMIEIWELRKEVVE